jgi:hypothetical protein
MYKEIEISKLPTKGVYYKDDLYIKIRQFSAFEAAALANMRGKVFMDQLKKLEFSLLSVDTNMDELDLCYTDVYYIYYSICAYTFKEVPVNYNGETIMAPIDPELFMFTNEDFSKQEDMFFDDMNLKFYHPSVYNMSKASENIILLAQEDHDGRLKEDMMLERLSLVPYMQLGKISTSALDFVNEHMMSLSDKEITKMREFINSKENLILGQKIKVNENGEEKELLIQLNQLI